MKKNIVTHFGNITENIYFFPVYIRKPVALLFSKDLLKCQLFKKFFASCWQNNLEKDILFKNGQK